MLANESYDRDYQAGFPIADIKVSPHEGAIPGMG